MWESQAHVHALMAIKHAVQTTDKMEYVCGCLQEWRRCTCLHRQCYWIQLMKICAWYNTQNQPHPYSLTIEAPSSETHKHSRQEMLRETPLLSFSNAVPYQSNEPLWNFLSVFGGTLTPKYTASLNLCNDFEMLKNIIKDSEKYARWQGLFFVLLCLCVIRKDGGHESQWMAWRSMEEEEEIKRKESRGLNIIKVFYIHVQKHQNETFCFVSTRANTDLLIFETII